MTLHLIENSSMMYRMFFGYPDIRRKADDHPVNVAHGCATTYWNLCKQHPSHVAVVLDKGKSTARLEKHPAYKAQRPPMKPDLACQIGFAREAAEAFGFTVVEKQGIEADDLIATLARMAEAEGHEVIIVSTDKDMMQLIRPGVRMFDPLKNTPIDDHYVERKWGVPPAQMVDLLAMVGDQSDNIPGMHGIGKTWAARLLTEYGSLENVIANAGLIQQDKIRTIIEDPDQQAAARLARDLIVLDEAVDMDCTIDGFTFKPFDTGSVLGFLNKMGLVTLRDEIAQGMGVMEAT